YGQPRARAILRSAELPDDEAAHDPQRNRRLLARPLWPAEPAGPAGADGRGGYPCRRDVVPDLRRLQPDGRPAAGDRGALAQPARREPLPDAARSDGYGQ